MDSITLQLWAYGQRRGEEKKHLGSDKTAIENISAFIIIVFHRRCQKGGRCQNGFRLNQRLWSPSRQLFCSAAKHKKIHRRSTPPQAALNITHTMTITLHHTAVHLPKMTHLVKANRELIHVSFYPMVCFGAETEI